jgi:hypothetical protein
VRSERRWMFGVEWGFEGLRRLSSSPGKVGLISRFCYLQASRRSLAFCLGRSPWRPVSPVSGVLAVASV